MPREIKPLMERAVKVLKAAGAEEVYLFGSAARGTMRDDSDVDIAVAGMPPVVFYKALGQVSTHAGNPA